MVFMHVPKKESTDRELDLHFFLFYSPDSLSGAGKQPLPNVM